MLNKSILIIVLWLFVMQLLGQSKYLPGKIIENNGDTIDCEINYRNWKNNPQKIYCRLDAESKVFTRKVFEIDRFFVKNEQYISAYVPIETSSTINDQLDKTGELKIEYDSTFLQVLFEGEKCLYANVRKGKENFYIFDDEKFILLEYKKYKTTTYSQHTKRFDDFIATNNKYIGQLKLYLNDCHEIDDALVNILYNRKKISKAFEKYYNCNSFTEGDKPEISFYKPVEKGRTKLAGILGVSYSTLVFSTNTYPLGQSSFSYSGKFAGGFALDYYFPRHFNNISIRNELLYHAFDMEGETIDRRGEHYFEKNTFYLSANFIQYSFMVNYALNIFELKVFGGLGASISIGKFDKNEWVKYTQSYDIVQTSQNELLDINTIEQCFVLRLGGNYKDFSLEARYEKGTGITYRADFKSNTKRFFLLIGYSFDL